MQMYHWTDCDFYRSWSGGTIVVMAESVEQAREKARSAAVEFVKANLADGIWEEDEDEYKHIMGARCAEFNRSIAKDPVVTEVVFVRGGD